MSPRERRPTAYAKRALYYVTRLFVGQLERGEGYAVLAKTIGILPLDFQVFSDQEDLHSTFRLYDEKHRRELTDISELHFIELPNFRKDKPRGLRTPFEKWLHVLKFAELYESNLNELPRVLREEEGIEMALDAMQKAWARDDVRELIEFRLKAEHDEANRMQAAEAKGRAEGEAKGRAEGEAKGRAEGEAKGRTEGEAKGMQEAARRMIEQGMDRDTVLRALNLGPGDLAGPTEGTPGRAGSPKQPSKRPGERSRRVPKRGR